MNRFPHASRHFRLLPVVLWSCITGCQDGARLAGPALDGVSSSQHAAPAALQVAGGGQAAVTDIDGGEYEARFSISAALGVDGSGRGFVNVVFDRTFSLYWGAVPDVTAILFRGSVTSISEEGGVVTLSGSGTETEVLGGGGQLLFEDEPFELVIDGPGHFTFRWCELPDFDFQVIHGRLATWGGAAAAAARHAAPAAGGGPGVPACRAAALGG